MILLSIDCVPPKDSRVKVYMRTPGTSFDHVLSIMTLGGHKEIGGRADRGAEGALVYSAGSGERISPRPKSFLTTATTQPVFLYFDIKPGSKVPDVKGYIPVRHYAKTDSVVADGLCDFLKKRGRGRYAEAYQSMLRGRASDGKINTRPGVQTFISFSFPKKGGLSLSSYMNPSGLSHAPGCAV